MLRFSVIIPLYNKDAFIADTLNSVLKQTFTAFEIIIVNDGSTDNSLKTATKLLSNFEAKTIVSQNNKGLSATRNEAIYLAKGDIVALLDADDLWQPKYLEELNTLATTYKDASIFGTDYVEFYSETHQLEPNKNIDASLKDSHFLIDDFFKASLHQPITAPSSFAFKRDVFNTITFNKTITFAEDIEFYIKTNLAYQMAFSYKPLVISRQDIPEQMTKVGFKGKTLPDFNQFEDIAKNNKSLKRYLDTYRYYFLSQCRVNNDVVNFDLMSKNLNQNNLTIKQRFLLNCPLFVLKFAKQLKAVLFRNKIKWTSY